MTQRRLKALANGARVQDSSHFRHEFNNVMIQMILMVEGTLAIPNYTPTGNSGKAALLSDDRRPHQA
ncbi:hypothetical protein TNCV_1794761 [Trichonephila clavipes]|nr:hypothetical protein TNCV_1794761 [Trichonephila clavipes]